MASLQKHKHAIMALVSLCIMYAVYTGVVFNTITLYMEPIITEYPDISRTQFMVMITIMGALNSILSLVAFGPMVSKFGVRKCMIIGAVSVCAALVVLATAQGLPGLYIGGVLFGIGITFEANGTTSMGVTAWFAKRTTTMIAITTTCGGVAGIVFAPVVGSWISSIGWRTSFFVALAITAVCSVVMIVLYRNSPRDVGETPMFSETDTNGAEKEAVSKATSETASEATSEAAQETAPQVAETGVSYKDMFKTPQFYCLAIAYFLVGVIAYSVMGNMAIFSADRGFDATAQGTVLSVIFATTAIMMIPGGALADKFGTKLLILICFVSVIGALILLMMDSSNRMMIYIAAALIGVGYVSVNVPVAVSAREGLGTKEYAKKMPVVLGCMLAGVALGNPILQLFYDIGGSYSTGFMMYIALSVVIIVLIFPGTKLAKEKK